MEGARLALLESNDAKAQRIAADEARLARLEARLDAIDAASRPAESR